MGYVPLKGVVISSIPHREKDKILIIFTDKLGKIRAKIRSVRSANSKRSGFADDFLLEKFLLYKKGDYYSVAETTLISAFSGAKSNIESYYALLYIKELVLLFTSYEDSDLRIFNLLVEVLYALSQGKPPKPVLIYFILKFLKYSGNEVLSGNKNQSRYFFDPEKGGFTETGGTQVSAAAASEMKFLSESDIFEIRGESGYEGEILELLNRFILYHTDSKHFSRFLETIKKLGNI